jgi:hypothetical protein
MRPTSIGAGAVFAALLLASPGPAAAQQASSPGKIDPDINIFPDLPDMTTLDGLVQAYRQLRGKPNPSPATAAPDDPPAKPVADVPETAEEAAQSRAETAAARLAVQRQGDAAVAARNSGYVQELAAIQVEDASTLGFLSTDCADNNKPSGACMNDVDRARKLEPRMQALLAKPGAADYLARVLKITWRPESPIRAAAVKLPLEPGTGNQAARAYVKSNSFRDVDGGFLGCRTQRAALLADGGQTVAKNMDIYAAYIWDPDKAISDLAGIEESAQAGGAANAYRICALRARWAELRLNTRNPPPPTQTLASAAPAGANGALANSLFNQSVGQAQINPQAAAAALQAQQNSRASELDDLTEKGKQRADAIMSAAMLGIQTYATTIQSRGSTPTVTYGSPSVAAALPAPARAVLAQVAPATTVARPAPRPAPAKQDASGCVRVVNAKNAGISSTFVYHIVNSCGFPVDVHWGSGTGYGTSVDAHDHQPLVGADLNTRLQAWRKE